MKQCNAYHIISYQSFFRDVLVALKRAVCVCPTGCSAFGALGAFSADSTGQLDIFRHDGNPLGMDGAQVGVFKQPDQIGLAGFLESHHGGTLKAELGLEVLGNLSNKSLEWKFADEKLGAFLVAADFSQGDSSRPVPMWLFHSSGGWGTLPGRLGCQLLSGSLPSGRFASRLLGACHGCLLDGKSANRMWKRDEWLVSKYDRYLYELQRIPNPTTPSADLL